MNLAACFLHVNKMQIRIVQGRNQMQVQQGQDLLLPQEGRGVRSKSFSPRSESTASAASWALTAFMQRKSIGHSRENRGAFDMMSHHDVISAERRQLVAARSNRKSRRSAHRGGRPGALFRSLVKSKLQAASSSISCSSEVCPIRLTQ